MVKVYYKCQNIHTACPKKVSLDKLKNKIVSKQNETKQKFIGMMTSLSMVLLGIKQVIFIFLYTCMPDVYCDAGDAASRFFNHNFVK